MQWILGAVAGSGWMALIAAVALDPPEAVNWNAVEAIGTVSAVFGAAMIAVWQVNHNKIEAMEARRLEADSMAAAMLYDLILLHGDLDRLAEKYVIKPDAVVLPESIAGNIQRLWILEQDGQYLIQLIALIRAHEGAVRRYLSFPDSIRISEVTRVTINGKAQIELGRSVCASAIQQLGRRLRVDPLPDLNRSHTPEALGES